MLTIVIIMIFSFMKDFLKVHNASWRSDLFVMNKKSDCFPLNLIFCKLLDTDRPCPSQIFQASTTQTILSSVTESLRLCSTEERSEMKEEVLGSVPNDLPRHLTTAPLPQELCPWLCVSPCQTPLLPQLHKKVPSLGHDPRGNAYSLPIC